MTNYDTWYYYCAIPAGKNLEVSYPDTDATDLMHALDYSDVPYTQVESGKILVYAEDLQKVYLPDTDMGNEYREFVKEMVDIKEDSDLVIVYLGTANGDFYDLVIEVLNGEGSEAGALTCTATRTCKNDASHTETAEATVTSEVEKEPTCTESGITKYTATFDVDWAETQTNSKVDIEALGHDEIDHEAKAPTCTEIGWDAYVTCSRCDYSTYVEKPALEHDWEVSYEWAENGLSCTATRVCKNDQNHTESARATVTGVVAKDPTCCTMGDTQYKAEFAVDWAETQYKAVTDIAIDEDAHEWGEWKTVKEPTTTEEGLKERECALCGDKEQDEIDKLVKPTQPSKPSDKPNPGVTVIIPGDKGEEKNPNTGAPVFDLTAAGVVVLMATAAVLEIKRRK